MFGSDDILKTLHHRLQRLQTEMNWDQKASAARGFIKVTEI
jgi:hypothetical protein